MIEYNPLDNKALLYSITYYFPRVFKVLSCFLLLFFYFTFLNCWLAMVFVKFVLFNSVKSVSSIKSKGFSI